MLYISILLTIWFVCWLYMQKFNHDTGCLMVEMMNYMIFGEDEEDEDKEDEAEHEANDDEESRSLYPFVCPKCRHEWYSTEKEVGFCPKCGERCE